jgi:TPR repeat protein
MGVHSTMGKAIFVLCFLCMGLISGVVRAEVTSGPRLVFIDVTSDQAIAASTGADISIISLDRLPNVDDANEQVLAAILKSSPISTFVSTDKSTGAESGPLYLVTALDLTRSSDDSTIAEVRIGDETFALSEVSGRLEALFATLNPTERQIAFVSVEDADSLLPSVLEPLSSAFDDAGLNMTVLMVRNEAQNCGVRGAPLEYAILSGLADRMPFGNGDGQTTAAEATGWISDVLTRSAKQQPECGSVYSLILRGAEQTDQIVARHGSTPLLPKLESALRLEEFEALFLRSSDDPAPISAYLASCAFCPHEQELTARLQTISEKQRAFDLESEVWASIRDDEGPDRLKIYLEHCQVCSFKTEAETRIARIASDAAARIDENTRFEALRTARDLNKLRAWRSSCQVCDHADEADALIAELLADDRLAEENAALEDLVLARDVAGIEAWLNDCELCDAQAKAQAALDQLAAEVAALGPCIGAAGLPQYGGPRLLADIDVIAAKSSCSAVLADHPNSPAALTLLGRIDQAQGKIPEARAAYAVGVAAGLPEAHGLAAYTAMNPANTEDPDYNAAETYALAGYNKGDWLSGEVLTLLYLQDLIEGKSAQNAYDIAAAHAREGNPVAQFFMGYFYNGGNPVPQSTEQAAEWFAKAVDQGYVHANSFLAQILETGIGGAPAETERAVDLYWKALQAGDQTALKRLTDEIDDRPRDVVRSVQTRLQAEGIFNGRVDGLPGPRTTTAVEEFAQLQTSGAESGG